MGEGCKKISQKCECVKNGKAVKNWALISRSEIFSGKARHASAAVSYAHLCEALDLKVIAPPSEMMDRAIQWAPPARNPRFICHRKRTTQRKIPSLRSTPPPGPRKAVCSRRLLGRAAKQHCLQPFDKAVAFRHEQNHLHNGLRGAAGAGYVPPAPALCQELMEELMAFANQPVRDVDPLVAAAVTALVSSSCTRSWTVMGACLAS